MAGGHGNRTHLTVHTRSDNGFEVRDGHQHRKPSQTAAELYRSCYNKAIIIFCRAVYQTGIYMSRPAGAYLKT